MGKVLEKDIFVRYVETDGMAIVHHSNYIIWFEEGRTAWMREQGRGYEEFAAEGQHIVVSEVNVRYRRPAVFGMEVVVRTWISDLKSRSMTVSYEVLNKENRELLCTGYTKHLCVDNNNKIKCFSDKWIEFFSR